MRKILFLLFLSSNVIITQVLPIKITPVPHSLTEIVKIGKDYLGLSYSDYANELSNDLFISNDNCKTWNEYTPKGIKNDITAITVYLDTLYAADAKGTVFFCEHKDSNWKKIEAITDAIFINELIAFNGFLLIGNRSDASLNSAVMIYDLKSRSLVNIKSKIPGNAGVNSFIILTGKVFAGTNNGFYYEEQPDHLTQAMHKATVNNSKQYPVGEYWYFPAKYSDNPFYVYDKQMPVNEFKNLSVMDIKYSPSSMNVYAATEQGLYYSDDDGYRWGKYFSEDDLIEKSKKKEDTWGSTDFGLENNPGIQKYLSNEFLLNVIPVKDNLIIKLDSGQIVFSGYKNKKLNNWKLFTPPKGKKGDFANITLIDDNRMVVQTETEFYLIDNAAKYLKGLK